MGFKKKRKIKNIDIRNETLRGDIKAMLEPMVGFEQNIVELATQGRGLKVTVEGENNTICLVFNNVCEYFVVDRFGVFFDTYNDSFGKYLKEGFNNILYSVKKENNENAFLVVTENYFIEIIADGWEQVKHI